MFDKRENAHIHPTRQKLSHGTGWSKQQSCSRLFEIASVLVCFDHVASIRDNGQRVSLRYTTVSKFDIAQPTQAGVSQANLAGIGLATFQDCSGGNNRPSHQSVWGRYFFSSRIGCVRFSIPEPTEWQHIGNQINAALVRARSDFVNKLVRR